MPHPDEHAFRIDIADLQRHDLGDAQAGSVGGHQSGAITNGADMLEKLGNFDGAEDYWKSIRNTASWKSVVRPRGFQRYVVKESGGDGEVVDRLRRIPALVDQVKLIFAKFLQAEAFGTDLIESGQPDDVMQISSLCALAEITQLHIFDHALTKRCHAKAPWMLDWSLGNNLIQCLRSLAPRQGGRGCEFTRVAVSSP